MRERSRARAWSLQVLYAWEARGAQGSPLTVLESFSEERVISEASRVYIRDLLLTIAKHRDVIDHALQRSLTNWRLERLAAIDRNILRLAAAEMMYIADIPLRVSIQEAIRLAEKFGTMESPRFVNGVLDALMHEIEEERQTDRPVPGEGN
jgi:transcription antitermination protein NusB